MNACRINSKLCSTCIFTSRSPITEESFEGYKKIWTQEEISQICHHSTREGDNVLCRGHYEAGKRREVYHPAVDAADMLFGEEHGVRIAEGMGFIRFVDVGDDE